MHLGSVTPPPILPLLAFLVPVIFEGVLRPVELAPDPSPPFAMGCNKMHYPASLFGHDPVPPQWCHVVNVSFSALLSIAPATTRLTVEGDDGPLEG